VDDSGGAKLLASTFWNRYEYESFANFIDLSHLGIVIPENHHSRDIIFLSNSSLSA
jgi:hypothetical protein